MNFESHDFRNMTSDAVYHYVKKRVVPGKRMYLFFDELQRLPPGKTRSILSGWTWTATPTLPAPTPICYPPSIPPISPDDAWRSKYCRSLSRSSWIFITLKFGKPAVPWAEPAGRYLIKTANATTHGRCLMPICVLGMPGIADIGLDQEKALSLLDGIYSTVVVQDILEREKRRGQSQITDSAFLRKIVLFLADNIGSSVSVSSIGNTLMNEGLLEGGKRKGPPALTRCRPISAPCWKATSFMKSSGLILRARSTCAPWANIIL